MQTPDPRVTIGTTQQGTVRPAPPPGHESPLAAPAGFLFGVLVYLVVLLVVVRAPHWARW